MSDLPGFTKLTSTPTKFRDLEMEDTFLQNLQVMNGGSKDFNIGDSSLTFEQKISLEESSSILDQIHIGFEEVVGARYSIQRSILNGEETSIPLYQSIWDSTQFVISILENNSTTGGVYLSTYGSIDITSINEETQQIEEKTVATTDQIIEYEGITKASDMNQATFWDADVVVPTGYTLTNTDGIPGEQITSGYISASRINNLSAGKITSGTFNVDRIPDLNASKITEGTFALERIPDLTTSKISDIETSYAKLSEGKISDSVIPDLSSTYAKLTNNKISENAIPDLSSTYASLTNSKISTSVIPNLGSSAGMTIDASLITNAPWKSSIKLSEMEIDQDLNMNEYSIIVGTTSSGKTAIYNRGLQTVTGGGDIYNLFNGDLVVDSITPAGLKLNVYGDLKLSSNHNIQTTGKITASTIDATMNLSKITIDTDLNLGDKNLTTTGTVTASNIPSST